MSWVALFAMRFLYGWWSRLYREYFEKQYISMPNDLPWTTSELLEFYKTCSWVPDTWRMAGDAVSKPEKFYTTRKGDCDEYAAFAADVLLYKAKWILSVVWWDSKPDAKTIKGHNVLIYIDSWRWWHIGNWGQQGPFKTFREALISIPGEGTYPIAWSMRLARGDDENPKDLSYLCGGRFRYLRNKEKTLKDE